MNLTPKANSKFCHVQFKTTAPHPSRNPLPTKQPLPAYSSPYPKTLPSSLLHALFFDQTTTHPLTSPRKPRFLDFQICLIQAFLSKLPIPGHHTPTPCMQHLCPRRLPAGLCSLWCCRGLSCCRLIATAGVGVPEETSQS